MDPPEKKSKSVQIEKKRESELMEVVVETKAEAGASGYSVVGGGHKGIFIKEVLKDSPAAKQLSLQKGDQLLSARVYFDNVKYEDALKILQCAEPYKVSFFLKRTVLQTDDSALQGAPNVELKGPVTKIQRMSIKTVKPFKVKKKRGGRFGLKRLKENNRARDTIELDTEGSPETLVLNPVDLEFAFPTFKMSKHGKSFAEESGQLEEVITSDEKKRKIRFPRKKARSAAVDMVAVDMSEDRETETSGAKSKVKGKGPKFVMKFPKNKKSKVASLDDNTEIEIKSKVDDAKVKTPKTDLESSDNKMKMPKIKLPKVRLSCHSDEVNGETITKRETSEETELNRPTADFMAPNVDVALHISQTTVNNELKDAETTGVKEGEFDMPSIDLSLPKAKCKEHVSLEADVKKGCNIKMPNLERKYQMPSFDNSFPKGQSEEKISTEEHSQKGGKVEMPKLDMSLPQMKTAGGEINIEGPDVKGGKIDMPDIDISLPKGKAKCTADLNVDTSKGGKFHMPEVDLSLPKMKSKDIHLNVAGSKGAKIRMPTIDVSLPQGKLEGDVEVDGQSGKGKKFEMPKFDLSLPKLKSPEVDISLPKLSMPEGQFTVEDPDVKGGHFSLPSIDISLPKGKTEGEIGIEGHSGKGGKIVMPKLDISLPKVHPLEGEISVEGPKIKGGKFHMPSVDISLPKPETQGDINLEAESKKGGKLKMPKFDISLPQMTAIESDISLPRGKAMCSAGLDIDGSKEKKFHMPDVNLSIPKIKFPEGEINNEGPDIKAKIIHDANVSGSTVGNIKLPTVKLPTVDISAPTVDLDFGLPKGNVSDREDIELLKAEESRPSSGSSFDIPDVTLKMPKITFPRFGGKFKSGDKEIGSPDLSADLDMERQSSYPEIDAGEIKVKVKKPIIQIPSFGLSKSDVNISGPEAEAQIKLSEISITKPEIKVECSEDKDKYKFKLPKLKISTPKVKVPKVDAPFDVEGEGSGNYKTTLDTKGKVKIPSVEISLPAANIAEREALLPKTEVDVSEADIKGYEGNLQIPKMPTIDISIPNVELDIALPKVKHDASPASSSLDVSAEGTQLKMPHFKMPKVDISLPQGRAGDSDNTTAELEVEGKGGKEKFKMPKITMPTVDISVPHGKTENLDVSELILKGKEGERERNKTIMSDIDLSPSTSKGNVKGPKVKGAKFNIGMPKGKTYRHETGISKTRKMDKRFGEETLELPDTILPGIEITGHSINNKGQETKASAEPNMEDAGLSTRFSLPNIEIKPPNLPELDFGNGTANENTSDNTDNTNTSATTKIPKFGVALPSLSLPQAKLDIKSPKVKGSSFSTDSEIEYEGPPMPKVKKAVFVLINPQTESAANVTNEGRAEAGYSEKSYLKGKGNGEKEVETEGKLPKFKLPKVAIFSGKTGSFDVSQARSDAGSGTSVNGDKGMFGKLKFPKVEFSSPYSKDLGDEADFEIDMKFNRKATSGQGKDKRPKNEPGKLSFPGFKREIVKGEEESESCSVVSSKARTEMLTERQGSESPVPNVSTGFVLEKTCCQKDHDHEEDYYASCSQKREEKEQTWFKVPKDTLSPHSTGIFHITPEGSPKGSKSSLQQSGKEASGGFYLTMPKIEFSTQETSSEHTITTTKEGTLTVVTKMSQYSVTESKTSRSTAHWSE